MDVWLFFTSFMLFGAEQVVRKSVHLDWAANLQVEITDMSKKIIEKFNLCQGSS